MGYFAVFHDRPTELVVTHCHINIWRSRERFSRAPYLLFDVGVGIRAAESRISGAEQELETKVEVALPFHATEAIDIGEDLHDPGTAQLVFGQPVNYDSQNGSLTAHNGDFGFRLARCEVPKDVAADGRKRWSLTIQAPPGSQERPTYVRIRFSVQDGGTAWSKDRSGTETFDFRVADARGAVVDETIRDQEHKMVEIETVNIFIIAPFSLIVQDRHPIFAYVRVLERAVWKKYLRNLVDDFAGKMLVRYWRYSDKSRPLGKSRVFTAFLRLSPSIRAHVTKAAILIGILVNLVNVAIAMLLTSEGRDLLREAVQQAPKILDTLWGRLGVGGVTIIALISAWNRIDWVLLKVLGPYREWRRRGKLRPE